MSIVPYLCLALTAGDKASLATFGAYNSITMNSHTPAYRIIPTGECIRHIESQGMTIHDDSEHLKSNSGLVYVLPTGEVVLVSTNFDLNYPAIIFKDLSTLYYFANLDSFPISNDDMTWFELYRKQIMQFRIHPEFYTQPLSQALDTGLPFRGSGTIKTAFVKLQSHVLRNRNQSQTAHNLHLKCSFGLAVISYLIDYRGYNLIFRRAYENYNATTNVFVEKDGTIKDVIGTCISFSELATPDVAEVFTRMIDLPSN